jgi:hypothetical protein
MNLLTDLTAKIYRLPKGEFKIGIVINHITGVIAIRTYLIVYLFTWVYQVEYFNPRKYGRIIKMKSYKK